MTTDPGPAAPWPTDVLDLPAYLARVGVSARQPSRAALDELLVAHARTFTFDNVDVLLRQHPGVSLSEVQEKFVGRGRGGYCFEHATLVHAVLTRLGYAVTPMLGRVGDAATATRTHLALAVETDGVRLLADPGIGVPPLGTIEIADGALLPGGLWPHRLVRTHEGRAGDGWRLERRRSDDAGWETMHTVDEQPVRRADVEVGHHWTSTAPGSHFRTALILNRHHRTSDGTPSLLTTNLDEVVTGAAGEAPVHERLELDDLAEVAARVGANLTGDEVDRLAGVLRALRTRGDVG